MMIPYGRQDISQSDIDAVVEVLRSDFLTQGPAVPYFEHEIATRVCAEHAIAVNSATSALHVACLALGLGRGDVLWTVPNTFVASANCALYCGADVDFVDIDSRTWNMSVPALAEKFALAERAGRLPKVLVPVHFGGQPTDQEMIWELARKYGAAVIEDASHAIGASRSGQPVGSCRWSDIVVFSFHPVKIITSGEGGIAVTNDAELAERMLMLRTHGITRDARRFVSREQAIPPWKYEQQMLGFNYRMTDLQAALGASQLTRLDDFVRQRNVLASRYNGLLAKLPLQLPYIEPENRSAYHLYVVRLLEAALATRTHQQVFEELRRRGVGVNLHYTPVHLQPYYRDLGFSPGQYPQAEAHAQSAITLPLFPTMSECQQNAVVAALQAAL